MARFGVVKVAAPQLSVELSFALRMMTLNICRPPGHPNLDCRLDPGISIEFEPELRDFSIRLEPRDCPNSSLPVTSIWTGCSPVDDRESFNPASSATRLWM